MMDFRPASPEERATFAAAWRGMFLVLFPGLGIAIGLIALVMPPRPPISTVYGCYRLGKLPLIRVKPSLISVDDQKMNPIPMTIETGKDGYAINARTGFSFERDGRGVAHVFDQNPHGELITIFVSQSRPPSLGLISDGELVKMPKVDCPTAPENIPHPSTGSAITEG